MRSTFLFIFVVDEIMENGLRGIQDKGAELVYEENQCDLD